MLPQLLTPLVLFSSLCLASAQGIPASGGLWTEYPPSTPPTVNGAVLSSRGDEIQVSGSYRMKVNHATGTVDPAPRAAFDPSLDSIIADGSGPVFWTRPWAEPNGTISARDWTTGVVTGTVTIPPGVGGKIVLDDLGSVFFSGEKLATAGFNGENPATISIQTPGQLGSSTNTIAAGPQWISVLFDTQASVTPRIEVYDRSTLAFKAGINPGSRMMSAHGDLLACLSGNFITIRQLPDLTVVSTIFLPQSVTLTDFAMVDGGLWVFQRAPNLIGSEFRYYDLGNPANPVPGNRLTAPTWTSYVGPLYQRMITGRDFIAFAADDRSLWAWRRGESGPIAKIVPAGSAREGSAASFKVQLSQAAPSAVQVQVTAESASAVQGQDFAAFSAIVNIPAGALESSAQEIAILQDEALEANESFTLASGSTNGCVVEETKVPVIIAANGFNREVQRQYDTNRTFRLQTVWGIDGPYLIGSGQDVLPTGGITLTVVMNAATGVIVNHRSGDGLSYSSDTRSVEDGVLFTHSLDTLTSMRLPSLDVIGFRTPSGGKLVGPLDAEHMVVTRDTPNRVMILKNSDGSVVATHASGINPPVVAIARSIEGVTGQAVVVQDSAFTPEGKPLEVLKILNPATLEPIRSFSWPSFHPQMGDSSELIAAGGRHAIYAGTRGVSAVDTVSGQHLWTVPTFSLGSIPREACISGDLLLMRGLSFNQASDEPFRYRFFDLKNGAVVEDLSFEELSGKPLVNGVTSILQGTTTGFVVVNGRQAVNVITNPTRPNVELLADPFEDNRSGELRVVAKENFAGSHALLIGEYAEVLEDRPPGIRLFGTLPQQIDFTAAGATLPLDCERPAATSEVPLFRAMSAGLPTAAAGFGKTTVTTHVKPAVEKPPFFTGGPQRGTYAVPVVASGNLLAVGYPYEPGSGVESEHGAVDLYDKSSGAFLRTIQPPAGVANLNFGHSLAFAGSRIVIGAPGNRGLVTQPGRVFVFDTATGAQVTELKLKKSFAFGSSIAANGSWIAIGAPGIYGSLPSNPVNLRGKPIVGSVAVFDANTYKLRYKASTKGELLGWSVALAGDTLYAGAPMASLRLPVSTAFAGIVRPYALPLGKKKGRPLPILGSIRPVERGYYGLKVATNSEILAVHAGSGSDDKKAVQIHQLVNPLLLATFRVPGADVGGGVLHLTEELLFAGGLSDSLRVFDFDDERPEASYSISTVRGVATDDDYFYWVDTIPRRAELPASSVAAPAPGSLLVRADPSPDRDLNLDGRSDAIDLLLQHRLVKGLPVVIEALAPGSDPGESSRFRFLLDADIPEGMAVSFEYSSDLTGWSKLLAWDAAKGRWCDAAGHAIGSAGTGNSDEGEVDAWSYDWQAPAGKTFFRTRVENGGE
jgi:hypothetical protein